MKNKILFTDTIGVSEQFKPKPASNYVPDWYKDTESYISDKKKPDGKGGTTATIKRCMPVFDAIVSGYILTTYVDVYVSQKEISYLNQNYFEKTGKNKPLTKNQIKKRNLKETIPYFEWPSYGPIDFHPLIQAPNYPNNPGHTHFPKWINPWSIKTPVGYSTLFIPPTHRSSLFTIMEGIVDTDKYDAPVNFPFVLNNINFEGLIPAGTPMVQVIPFKRDSWEMEIGSLKDLQNQFETTRSLRTNLFDGYKSLFRHPKEYK